MATLQPKELGLTGQGVAPVKIEAIDELAERYIDQRDQRIALLRDELSTKQSLITELHNNADKIRMPDGELVYHYDETVIRLTAGKEKLKVESLELGNGQSIND
jgi:rare lipoprotein A (peptidoglycan hydrolase)